MIKVTNLQEMSCITNADLRSLYHGTSRSNDAGIPSRKPG